MELHPGDTRSETEEIAALLAAAEAAGDPAPLSEEAEHDVASGRLGLVAADGDRVFGYVHHRTDGSVTILEPVLAPGIPADAAAEVVAHAIGSAGPGLVHLWTASDAVAVAARGEGFRPDRRVECLERVLPVAGAEPIVTGMLTAGFRPEIDEEAVLLIHREAFAGHADLGGWDRRNLEWRFRLPWFDPAGLVLAWERGRPVAVVWIKEPRPGDGEIYLIACRPAVQGRGLGKAMTILGLRLLSDRGARSGRVFTDADNAAAKHVYLQLGFESVGVRTRWVGKAAAN
jgi:mycothiol synthase